MRARVISCEGVCGVLGLLVLEWVCRRVHWGIGDGKSSVMVGFLPLLVVEA